MDEVESPVIGRKSLETGFQSPALEDGTPAMSVESLAIGLQLPALEPESPETGL
jgi:hypothetical protein